MNRNIAVGFLAASAFVASLIVAMLCIFFPESLGKHELIALLFSAGSLMVGVVTVNWTYPATGAVNPTAQQMISQSEGIVTFTTTGAELTFTATHNMNISAADLALGFPDVLIEPASVHAADGTGAVFISSKTANTVVFTCLGVVLIVNVKVTRPHSLVR